MAFFLESTFIGLFFFGWDRLSRGKHLLVTFLMALGSNLSALWILVANGWMMNPIGAEFNFETMRMEMTNFWAVFTSEWAQAKFVHTIGGGYMTGSFFVMAISAYYMLKRQDVKFAASSFRLAAAFGLVAAALRSIWATNRATSSRAISPPRSLPWKLFGTRMKLRHRSRSLPFLIRKRRKIIWKFPCLGFSA